MRGMLHAVAPLLFLAIAVAEFAACIQWLGVSTTIFAHIFVVPGILLGVIACFKIGWWFVPVIGIVLALLLSLEAGDE